jgi:hypothetical protein
MRMVWQLVLRQIATPRGNRRRAQVSKVTAGTEAA